MQTDFFGPGLNDGKHVFVFGSNAAGRHGKGAALEAKRHWGAEQGVGEGPAGNSYALPTKDDRLRPRELFLIGQSVQKFLRHARCHPDRTFLVTKVGCGLAGFGEEDIKPFFRGAPKNCVLPAGW